MNVKPVKPPAKSARHRARELALQGIYQWRVSGSDPAEIEKTTRAEKSLAEWIRIAADRIRDIRTHVFQQEAGA